MIESPRTPPLFLAEGERVAEGRVKGLRFRQFFETCFMSATDYAASRQRISSRRPQFVVLLAALGSVSAVSLTAQTIIVSGQMSWVMFALGIANSFVALAGFMTWKQVWRGERHYVVSSWFKAETIPFDDVCIVLEARGLIWNTVRIHFNRPTRFGWGVSFVPALSAGTPGEVVTAWRTRSLAK